MIRILFSLLLCSIMSSCVFDDGTFDHQINYELEQEKGSFTGIDLTARSGHMRINVGAFGSPVELNKKCLDSGCSETELSYNGFYTDFSLIVAGDWTGDLTQLSQDEVKLRLLTLTRKISATVYFHKDFDYNDKLLFQVDIEQDEFHGLADSDGFSVTVFPDASFDTLFSETISKALEGDNEVPADMYISLRYRFKL